MLRIRTEETQKRSGRWVRLMLEGKLTGPWVEELEKTWDRVSEEPAAAIKVDLCAVTSISRAGEKLLRRLETKGAELRPGSLWMRAWVTAMRAEMRHSAAIPGILIGLLLTGVGYGQQVPRIDEGEPALAFGRYLASLQERNPFTESEPIEVEIEASLPGLGKEASMLAVRQTGASERSEYSEIKLNGDSTVRRQVIARYLAAEDEAEGLPYSSVAVTPANYKFRYVRSLETNGTTVYVFQITPKKKRAGLIRGQIWIDPETGIAVHQVGRFVKRPSIFIRGIEVARDTNLRDGLPHTRVTLVCPAAPQSHPGSILGSVGSRGAAGRRECSHRVDRPHRSFDSRNLLRSRLRPGSLCRSHVVPLQAPRKC
jgi:hypothetical protein